MRILIFSRTYAGLVWRLHKYVMTDDAVKIYRCVQTTHYEYLVHSDVVETDIILKFYLLVGLSRYS